MTHDLFLTDSRHEEGEYLNIKTVLHKKLVTRVRIKSCDDHSDHDLEGEIDVQWPVKSFPFIPNSTEKDKVLYMRVKYKHSGPRYKVV